MHAVIVHPHCEIFLIRCYLYQCVYFQNKTLPNVEDLMLDSMGGSWADPKGDGPFCHKWLNLVWTPPPPEAIGPIGIGSIASRERSVQPSVKYFDV